MHSTRAGSTVVPIRPPAYVLLDIILIYILTAIQCAALYDTLGVTASYPHTPTFAAEQTGPGRGYWSLQEVHASLDTRQQTSNCGKQSELIPTCRVTPANARDAATAVLILSRLNCPFAVRGGGHMSWAGGECSSNILTCGHRSH